MEIAYFIGIGLIGIAFGIALGRYVWPSGRKSDLEALSKIQSDCALLQQECNGLRERTNQLKLDLEAADEERTTSGEEVARLNERVVGLTRKLEEQAKLYQELGDHRKETLNESKLATAEVARLKEREASLVQKIETQKVELANLHKQLVTEFENIANRILKANTNELSETSKKGLAAVLDPLHQRIQDFQKKVETTYETETREVLSLKEQIKHIIETSHAIGSQADGLAKALRGDRQLLGRWGELTLERILEAAGLAEGREFVSQGRGLGLKSDDGGTQKPDIVLLLPEKRTMIVDSKVPLISYERLIAAKDETDRANCADQFVRDMKGHIDDLSGKRYQEGDKLQAHDCVLMFVPIEGALAAALTREPELFVYGWNKRVVLVGPPTLLMTMKTVASIWRYEYQQENVQEIARLAGDLCNKVSTSLNDLNSVHEKITGALNAHNDAVKRFATGKGNVLSLGERIRALGVKTKGPMPSMIIDNILVANTSEESESTETSAKATEEPEETPQSGMDDDSPF